MDELDSIIKKQFWGGYRVYQK